VKNQIFNKIIVNKTKCFKWKTTWLEITILTASNLFYGCHKSIKEGKNQSMHCNIPSPYIQKLSIRRTTWNFVRGKLPIQTAYGIDIKTESRIKQQDVTNL